MWRHSQHQIDEDPAEDLHQSGGCEWHLGLPGHVFSLVAGTYLISPFESAEKHTKLPGYVNGPVSISVSPDDTLR